MNVTHNERTKLLASALSNAGVGCFTAGVIGTIAAIVVDFPGVRDRWDVMALIGAIWLLVGINLHMAGQVVLGRLKDDS